MKSLKEYILEELDINLFWLLDKWFERNETQQQEFNNIIMFFINQNVIDIKDIIAQLQNTSLLNDIKPFVNFIENNNVSINPNDDIDTYYERFKMIVKQVLSKKKI